MCRYRAAIQAGLLSGEVKDLLLLDAICLLGIETLGGDLQSLLKETPPSPPRRARRLRLPTVKPVLTSRFTRVNVKWLPTTNFNFQLTGIPIGPRGVPQIEVTFDIDPTVLYMLARDLGTGNEQNITTASTNLSEEDIDRAVKEAERFAEEDRREKKA